MLRIRKFGENSCGYNAALWNCRSFLRGYATMSFRQGYALEVNLKVRDALPFNQLMRNFKQNSSCYDDKLRNFDRIELWRSPRRKSEIPSAGVVATPIRSKLCVRRMSSAFH